MKHFKILQLKDTIFLKLKGNKRVFAIYDLFRNKRIHQQEFVEEDGFEDDDPGINVLHDSEKK